MAEDLLTRMEADRRRYAEEREVNRKRFPEAMALFDSLRDEAFTPKLKYARNAAGEEIGRMLEPKGLAVHGEKLARLPEYLEKLTELAPKNWADARAYASRAARCIKPDPWRTD